MGMVNSKTVKKMKTRNFIVFIAAGVAVMASFGSCTKEFDKVDVPENEIRTVVTAGLDAATKTYMGAAEEGKRKVYWENGDAININGVASAPLSEVEEDAVSATFTFEGVLEKPYKAVYPASIYKDAATVTLPSELVSVHDLKEASFAQNALPMAAYSESGSLTFRHLCSVLKLTLTSGTGENPDLDMIRYVEFSGKNGEQVSGDFTIDYTAQTLSLTPSSAPTEADKIVRVNVGRDLSAEGIDIYVTVPADVFQNGFSVKIVDVYGHYMTVEKKDPCEFKPGKVVVMQALAFEPQGTQVDVEIASAEQLVQFAKDYNAGKYVTPVVNLTADITFDDNTAAAFESIGIGEENYFNGYFNGNGKSIKGYTALKPIFRYIGGAGYVSNLTIDETCVFNIVCNNEVLDFGPLVYDHKGEIRNCHSNAKINISGENTSRTRVGGLVRRVYSDGLIEGCSYGGTISAKLASTSTIVLGGIASFTSYQDVLIKNSIFKGYIDCSSDTKITAYLGGIVGDLTGTAEDCVTESENEGKERIKFQSSKNGSQTVVAGGIAGVIEKDSNIFGCDNTGDVYVQLYGNGTRCFVGGLAGQNNGNVDDSSNGGEIGIKGYRTRNMLGGLLGQNNATASIANSTNTGLINALGWGKNSYSYTDSFFGGVCGENSSSNIEGISNQGDIQMPDSYFYSGAYICVGGLIGNNKVEIKSTSEMTNEGQITITEQVYKTDVVYVGGAVGYTSSPVEIVSSTTTPSVPETNTKWKVNKVIGEQGETVINQR